MADLGILKAIKSGNFKKFQSYLNSEEIKQVLKNYFHSKSGDTIIHNVCRMGNLQILSILFEEGFSVEVQNFDGKSALHEAAQGGHLDCTKFLLQARVKVDALKRADWTPLMLACTKDNTEIISLLLKYGANPKLVNKDGWNSFHIAAREGHLPVIQILLDQDASLWETVSKNGRTPLHTAVLHEHVELVEHMLDKCGYKTDMQDSCGTTPLMDALRVQNIEIARLLIKKHKASVSKRDNLGRQAIHQDAQAGAVNSVRFLVEECGVDPSVTSLGQGVSPLHTAAKEGQSETLLLLLSLGANVSCQDDKGRTALHIAAGAQHVRCVEVLLQNGAQSLPDSSGTTPRQLARKQNVIDVFDKQLLIT